MKAYLPLLVAVGTTPGVPPIVVTIHRTGTVDDNVSVTSGRRRAAGHPGTSDQAPSTHETVHAGRATPAAVTGDPCRTASYVDRCSMQAVAKNRVFELVIATRSEQKR